MLAVLRTHLAPLSRLLGMSFSTKLCVARAEGTRKNIVWTIREEVVREADHVIGNMTGHVPDSGPKCSREVLKHFKQRNDQIQFKF